MSCQRMFAHRQIKFLEFIEERNNIVVKKLLNMDWQQNLDQTGLNQSLLLPPTQGKGGGGGHTQSSVIQHLKMMVQYNRQ